MLPMLTDADVLCPYCGETISLLLDLSDDGQQYVEDCSVCCRPITIRFRAEGGEVIGLDARREDESH